MRRFYGYTLTIKGLGYVNQEEAEIICFIYNSYLEGHSLGGISKLLQQRGIDSPTGNPVWGRAAIDKMLSNPKYLHYVVDREVYSAVQDEKVARSNVDTSAGKPVRKVKWPPCQDTNFKIEVTLDISAGDFRRRSVGHRPRKGSHRHARYVAARCCIV